MADLHRSLPDGPSLILEGRDGTVYVAVYGSEDGVILRRDHNSWQAWYEGPLKGMQIAPDGDIWVSAGGDILRYHGENAAVNRTPSFLPHGTPGPLLATRAGDVWGVGCSAMHRGDAHFEATPSGPAGWTITPCCDDPFGNAWAIAGNGRHRDLAVLNPEQPHAWRRIELPTGLGSEPWTNPIVDDSGFIWIGLQRSVFRVDPRTNTAHTFATPGDSAVISVARIANRQIAVGFDDGSIRELVVVGPEDEWSSVQTYGSSPIRAMLHDRDGHLWILAGGTITCTETLRATWQTHWDEQPRMPAGNHDHIFARIGDRLYTAGGKTFFGWPADDWVNLDHVWSYSITDGTWRTEPPMLEPGKAYSGIAALADELWLLGGYFRDEKARSGTRPTDTVEIFSPKTRSFRLGPPLPQAVGQIVALTAGDRLYAIGGDGKDNSVPDVISIAIGEAEWHHHTSAPGPVSQASGCVLDGRIYLAAGPSSECLGLFVYDPGLDSWSRVEHPMGRAPSAPLCTAFDGKIWVMGGRGDGGGQTATYIYEPDTNQWQQGPDIPLPVSWAAAADIDGRLLIAGGAYEDERVGGFYNTDRVFLLRQEAIHQRSMREDPG